MISTAINYPENLPAPLLSENSYTPVSPNERTSMDSGRARQRKKFSSVPTMRSASWIMTATQARMFEFWYRYTLKEGTEWFNISLKNPLGYTPLVCRVVGIYQGPRAFSHNLWRYQATLEVWERPLIPAEWAILPTFILNPEIFDIAMNREWPEA